jgi:hypothetical protein
MCALSKTIETERNSDATILNVNEYVNELIRIDYRTYNGFLP